MFQKIVRNTVAWNMGMKMNAYAIYKKKIIYAIKNAE
jgi:hypothetical protein